MTLVGRWATVIALIAIIYLAIEPSNIQTVDAMNDKGKHTFAFFVLTVGFLGFWRFPLLPVGLSLLAFGVAIECMQYFIPGREASFRDVMADLLGILLGVLLVRYAPKKYFPFLHAAP